VIEGVTPVKTRSSQAVAIVLQAAALDEIKPLMRQLVQLLEQHDGLDHFELEIEGMDVAFGFPNMKTNWTPQLERQVRTLPGVREVRTD
jgi:hypothetical protein